VSITIERNWKGSPIKYTQWMPMARRWAKDVTPFTQEMVREHAPVYHGYSLRESGKLKRSIEATAQITNTAVTIEVITGVPYAEYVMAGVAPHIIVPRKAKMLRWNGPNGEVFARMVNHPGQKANDFVRRAMLEVEPLAMELFAAYYRESFIITKE